MTQNKHLRNLVIAISGILIAVLVITAVVLIDSLNSKADTKLSVEDAQELINTTIDELPTYKEFNMQGETIVSGAQYIVNKSNITVNEVRYGNEKDIILSCTYETIDVYSEIEENLNALLTYTFVDGKSSTANATSTMIATTPKFIALLENAEINRGEIDIYIYDVPNEGLKIYLSDEMVNTVLGGILSAQNLISNTNRVTVDGEIVDITSNNSLRTGCIDCLKLDNYDKTKPDTSSWIGRMWNGFKADFHKNFIEQNRYMYLVKGLGTTLAITAISLLLGLILGFIVAIIRCTNAKTGKLGILSGICKLYLSIMRGTPVMIQLLIIYFVMLLPLGVNKFLAAVICFGVNSGAYVSEIVRGGIMSIDEGQTEAGRSLGLSYVATMWYIVIPQAFKAILPSLANEFIALLKETSVAFYIGVADLTQGGLKIRSVTYSNFMPLIAIALIYLVLVLGLSYLVSLLERRLRKSEK